LRLKQKLMHLSLPLNLVNFLGAGATEHFVPEWVSQQLLRAEWYTSYTPYQPELSQGTLQAIFEFQSMVASLFGLNVANASLYDGATALVEAVLMATRLTGKKTVLIASSIHPEYRETLRTYLSYTHIKLKELSFNNDGTVDQNELLTLAKEFGKDLAAIALSSPNFFGVIDAVKPCATIAHEHNALLIALTTDMSSCALLKSFGHDGADIAVGEGLSFLPGINCGGPGVGLMAAKKEFVRQMPGRLVGLTRDAHKNPCYVLTLSGREQHIRREKATSNICTNHNLMALAFAMSMAAYGRSGLKRLSLINLKKTLYFRQCLHHLGMNIAFFAPHYNETVINFGSEELLDKRLKQAR
ncbi:MAG TPA: aminomethyl-transferring glycine dehydrogenase subunit GcvPA, partial [Myxococcota bacterium]|nr:aminomethyl-transferring glycine dehydrogenase subunit GcvPA [Myxococcota bacterium]